MAKRYSGNEVWNLYGACEMARKKLDGSMVLVAYIVGIFLALLGYFFSWLLSN